MSHIKENYSVADLLREWNEFRDDIQFVRQMKRLEAPMEGGRKGYIQRTPTSHNAILKIRQPQSTVTNIIPPDIDNNTWADLARANGGCVTPVAIQIAGHTHAAISAATFADKILMLWPFLGCNVISFRVPLIDRLGKGLLTNVGFTDAQCNQALGVRGDTGQMRYFNTNTLPSELGPFNSGGMFWWETDIAGGLSLTNVSPMGSFLDDNIPDNRFCFDLRTLTRAFRWGTDPTGLAGDSSAPANGFYYGQSPNAGDRQFYFDGSLVAQTTDTVDVENDNTILLMGIEEGTQGVKPWGGRGFLAGLTDATMTAAEIAALKAILLKYLVNPKITGVPVPYLGGVGNDTFPDPADPENAEESDCETCINSILVDDVTLDPLVDDVTKNVLTEG